MEMLSKQKGPARKVITEAEFYGFTSSLIGLPVSYVWRGYGSAIFLEFGTLKLSSRHRRDGSLHNPTGEWTLGVEWSWRIRQETHMVWQLERCRTLAASIWKIAIFEGCCFGAERRLPEIDLSLENGLHVVSCATIESDPEWGLTWRQNGNSSSLGTLAGRLIVETNVSSRNTELAV